MQRLRTAVGIGFILIGLLLSTVYFIPKDLLASPAFGQSRLFSLYILPFGFWLFGIGLLRRQSIDHSSGVVFADGPHRILAFCVKSLVLLALFLPLNKFAFSVSGKAHAISGLLFAVLFQVVNVWLLKRYGASIGKLIVGLRVLKADLTPIGYREALIRSSVEMTLSIASAFVISLTLLRVNYDYVRLMPYFQASNYILASTPPFYAHVMAVLQLWVWADMGMILFNMKRRAIHDYMAGTMVVLKSSYRPTRVARSIAATSPL
ncbi:MAG: RDD family protein [Fibrobacterota bacterium]